MLNLNRDEPKCFRDFKIKNKPHRYVEDCDDYDLRECLRISLLQEQKKQCFYCEKKIDNRFHIDHIKQRKKYTKLECIYSNMALSCNSNNHCANYKDANGIWKDKKHLRIVSQNPELQESISNFFYYSSNGQIEPKASLSEDEITRTKNTIDYLNLNHRDLVKIRKQMFSHLVDYKDMGYDTDEIFTFFCEFESIFKEFK